MSDLSNKLLVKQSLQLTTLLLYRLLRLTGSQLKADFRWITVPVKAEGYLGRFVGFYLTAADDGDDFEAIALLNFRCLPKLAMQNLAVILYRHQTRIQVQLFQQLR